MEVSYSETTQREDRTYKQQQLRTAKHRTASTVTRDKIGGACNTHGSDEKCTQYFGWKT